MEGLFRKEGLLLVRRPGQERVIHAGGLAACLMSWSGKGHSGRRGCGLFNILVMEGLYRKEGLLLV